MVSALTTLRTEEDKLTKDTRSSVRLEVGNQGVGRALHSLPEALGEDAALPLPAPGAAPNPWWSLVCRCIAPASVSVVTWHCVCVCVCVCVFSPLLLKTPILLI